MQPNEASFNDVTGMILDVSEFNADMPLKAAAFSVDVAHVPLEGGEDPAYGSVRWKTLMGGPERETPEFVFGIAEYGPHGSLPAHRHSSAEFYFGLDGSGVVTIDGEAHLMSAGIAIYIPGDAEHAVLASDTGLRFAYGFAESSFTNVVYRFSENIQQI
jgi:quercetin dioxygenase-like cupin family protein